jgi:hypothetical protein
MDSRDIDSNDTGSNDRPTPDQPSAHQPSSDASATGLPDSQGGVVPPAGSAYGYGYPSPYPYLAPVDQGPQPPDHQALSLTALILSGILSFFSCIGIFSLPFAIAGMVFSSQVNPMFLGGNAAGAQEASRKAKLFSTIALVVLGALTLLGILLVIVVIGISAAAAAIPS